MCLLAYVLTYDYVLTFLALLSAGLGDIRSDPGFELQCFSSHFHGPTTRRQAVVSDRPYHV